MPPAKNHINLSLAVISASLVAIALFIGLGKLLATTSSQIKVANSDEFSTIVDSANLQASATFEDKTNTNLNNNNNNMQRENSELKVDDVKIGTGREAVNGKVVTVNYTGTLVDGTVFDSSLKPGRTPFDFMLGRGMVIRGWELGVAGMKVGGKRKLTIGPDLAYGSAGAGGVIPPNATLVFEVELLKVSEE